MNRVLGPLTALARAASGRSDIIVATFMMLAMVMMIIPLPTLLVDALIAINIALSLLVLVVAFYIGRPAEFSTLPPIILLATLFRLALSITTTRLILLQADAGSIVQTFGEFVIGGQIIVGLVVFLIITAAQFIVITKGAERVAEVAARFTLDAMPGKQMSIDNDLRNGDIDTAEARLRRSRLERESQLYGAMDGAMKFVKGDAITGLIIVFVNLIGGLVVGMVNHGMTFADAGHTYSLLTVGDGLIAQIPSLMISLAAGTVVTRVASDSDRDLGTEIMQQLGSSERPLVLAAVVLGGAALVPGFPTLIFLALAALFGGLAFGIVRRRKAVATTEAAPPLAEVEESAEEPVQDVIVSDGSMRHKVVVQIGPSLARTIWSDRFRRDTNDLRADLQADLGLDFPAVELRMNPSLAAERFQIDLDGVPIGEGDLPQGMLLLNDETMHLDMMRVPWRQGPAMAGQARTVWVADDHLPALEEAGVGVLSQPEVLTRCLGQSLRRYAANFIGIQETRELLTRMEAEYGELVREMNRVVPLNRLSDILRRLVEEDVPIANMRAILEALIEWAPRDADTLSLTERVRAALARQICHRHAQMNRVLAAYVTTRPAEETLRGSVKQTGLGPSLLLGDAASRQLLEQLRRDEGEARPVLLTAMDLRFVLRHFLLRHGIEMPVLSYQEIAADYSVQSLQPVTMGAQRRPAPLSRAADPA
ncbi:type III secretion system export apparatus subunit SctV [Falsirhodobacter sp. 20TX0035]|uniref:type III secretion system export apparatus subunit SctV n=1 Tax=Falsirhodobacter sp. 20TX0035 TaxID=3022019 RepID=UPI00232F369A|nr:type III secretion system export apparatus subunit SctV [Falsirhodobacter sp. 20TX0035]MDB6454412.1 type III secretion system export apparatus subunit SctV [Falsirhodobacter sp. 20TX0035]